MAYKKPNSKDNSKECGNTHKFSKNRKWSKSRNGKRKISKSREIEENDSKFTDTPSNDPRWYGVGNPLIQGTYNFPQFTPLGGELVLHSNSRRDNTMPDFSGFRLPGVMTYNWSPIFPSELGAGALNSAFANMFSYVRHANSGHANYSMGALGCYSIAATGIVAWMANLRRLYGFMHNFDGTNMYYPKVVVEAMGFDYEDLVTNLPQLYAYINYATAKCSSIWLPITNTLPFRWEFMNSEIYQDSSTIKPQTYFYKMDGIYVWRPESSSPGEAGLYYVKLGGQKNANGFTPCVDPDWGEDGMYCDRQNIRNFVYIGTFWNRGLTSPSDTASEVTGFPSVWPVPGYAPEDQTVTVTQNYYGTAERLKFQGIKYFTEWLINSFINDEDRGIIAGDLLKAYGAENMYKWPTIPEFYTVVPKFDPEVNMQFRNTRTPNWDIDFQGQSIADDGSSLTIGDVSALFNGFSDMCEIDHVLTFDNLASESDLAVATRNVPFTDGHGHVITAGTEVITCFQMWYKSSAANEVVGSNPAAYTFKFNSFVPYSSNRDWAPKVIDKLVTFNVKPLIYLTANTTSHNYVKDLWFDADNYFPYTLQNALMVNTAAVSFEYGVPLAVGVKK